MRSMPFLTIAALLCVAAAPVGAQDRPRYVPTRDVVVQYAVASNQPGVPPTVTAHLSSSGHLRLDTPDYGTVFYDIDSAQARWLMPQSDIYIALPVGNSLAGSFAPGANASFRRTGSATIAGLSCETWQVTVSRGNGTACVTDTGVILSAAGEDARGHTGTLTATSVTFQPQPASVFEPPPGSHRLDLPHGLAIPSQLGR